MVGYRSTAPSVSRLGGWNVTEPSLEGHLQVGMNMLCIIQYAPMLLICHTKITIRSRRYLRRQLGTDELRQVFVNHIDYLDFLHQISHCVVHALNSSNLPATGVFSDGLVKIDSIQIEC